MTLSGSTEHITENTKDHLPFLNIAISGLTQWSFSSDRIKD